MSSREFLTDTEIAGGYVGRSMDLLYPEYQDREALEHLSEKTGLGFWTLWGLANERRKTAKQSEIWKLRRAYLALCEQKLRRLEAEIRLERALGNEDAALQDIAGRISAMAVEVREAQGRAD